jgi:hypothetical protein
VVGCVGESIERMRAQGQDLTLGSGATSRGVVGWRGAPEHHRERGHIVIRRPPHDFEERDVEHGLGTRSRRDWFQSSVVTVLEGDDEPTYAASAERNPDH